VDDGDALVLVEDRLAAIGQADDAEPARGEADTRSFQIAVFVRPAVDDGVRHGMQPPCRHGPPLPGQVNHPCDAAHAAILSLSGGWVVRWLNEPPNHLTT